MDVIKYRGGSVDRDRKEYPMFPRKMTWTVEYGVLASVLSRSIPLLVSSKIKLVTKILAPHYATLGENR